MVSKHIFLFRSFAKNKNSGKNRKLFTKKAALNQSMHTLITTINSKYIHQNLAIRILYAMNHQNPHVSWKEFTLKEETEIIAQQCASFDVIVFSCYIWNISKTLEACNRIKTINPNSKIMLGGPEVSHEWEPIMQNPHIDFIILGEGEIPFAEFLKHYPNTENIPSLVWRNNGEIRQNTPAPPIDIEHLATIDPYQFDTPDEMRTKVLYIEASRGCPYRCGYCLAGLDNQLRFLPLDAIKHNLLHLMKHGRVIKFLDRTFNARPAFAIEIMQFILDNHQVGNVFQFEIKADRPQPELVDFIQTRAPKGLFRFEIGIQTLNQRTSQEIARVQDFENICRFVEQVHSYVDLHLDLIVGLPFDYWNDIRETLQRVFLLFQPELQLGFLKMLKGTPIRNNAAKHDYVFEQTAPYQITASKYLSASELEQISLVEHALEIYWNKKRALNAMRYVATRYHIFDFLLGLGDLFEQTTGMHGYSTKDVYENLYKYAQQALPNDSILAQLIAMDYYLQPKMRPPIRFLNEPSPKERAEILIRYKLNIHKFRYVLHHVNFDIAQYLKDKTIVTKDDILIVCYNGVSAAKVIISE